MPSEPEPGSSSPPTGPAATFARTAAVFAAVRRHPPGPERDAALAEACRGDAGLASAVARLLAAHDRAGRPAEAAGGAASAPAAASPLRAALDAALTPAAAPTSLGGYRILGVLGTGGMGTVYDAEQASPRRRVALKVLRDALGSRDARERFAREGELLARMEHDGIARVYEVGAADGPSGRVSFIAMERVDGVDLRTWLARTSPPLRARVALLARVADALAHAHRKGVIHRDLKPGNVLVTADGAPKVLDFGIARLADGTDGATRTGTLLGTVGHMSPEQLAGDARRVDTRSDVFALGVLAYEALAGRHPFDAASGSVGALLEAMRGREAPTLATVADDVPRDLSVVVARAMALDPERRYPTAEAFADDLRRFLDGRVVLARPPTRRYVVGRFVARHRVAVTAAAAVLVALVAGLGIAVAALGREREARRGADASADRAARAAARASTRAAAHQLERVGSARARELIADVEPAYRGWEWRLLDALTDDTLDAVDLPEVAPGATVVVSVDGDGRLRVADPAALGPRPPSTPSEGTPSDDDPGGLTPTTGVVPPDVHVHDAVAGAYVTIGRHRPAPRPFELDGVACRLERVPGGDVIVRREADGVAVRTLAGHKDRVVADARSADGRRLVTLSLDRTLRVWDLAEGTSVSLRQNETNPWAIALSPDGAQVVVAGRFNGGVLVRPVARTDDGERLLGAREPVLAVGRSADGRFLVVVGVRKARSFALGARADLDVLARHDAGGRRPVLGVAVDPTGRLLATVGLDQSLRLTDLVTTDAVAVWKTAGLPASVAWDPRGRWLVHAADELVVHDARDGTRLASARPPDADGRASRPARLVVAADGEALFATTVAAGPVGVWGLPGLAYRGAWPVRAFGVAPFARAGDDRAVVVRDDGTAALVPLGDDAVPPRVLEVVGPASVAVAPDGGTAVFGTLGGSAYVHDLRAPAGTPPRVWRAVRDTVTSAAFAPDGSRVFLGFGDNRVAVWDPEAGTEQLVLERHRSMVTGLAVTPDGTTVVAADGQGTVLAWSTEPLAVRWRRAAEERGRVAAWRTRLRARLAAGETAAAVRASLDADPGLSARERGSAWVALLTEVFGR